MDKGVQRGRRRLGALPLAAQVVAPLIAFVGCTAGTSIPQPSDLTQSSTGPSMTVIPDAVECVQARDLGAGAGADLPVKDLFERGVKRAIHINEELVPGRDAGDGRCAGRFPAFEDVDCGLRGPWARTGWGDLLVVSGARRVRHVELVTEESDPTRPDSASRIMTYAEIELPPHDAKQTGQFAQAAFEHCTGGTDQLVHGVPAVVGFVPSESEPSGVAAAVAFLTPERVDWVVLDGQRPWTNAERHRALAAVAAHLS
ncbi:MAG TPA: hypothetical protein VFL38_03530 [Humibacillus xanthopallidus]|nr:hypothetical protein [Humibacillus xanthopallidus]